MEKTSKKIGFIINDSTTDYGKELIAGISEECEKNDSSLLIFPVGEFGMTYDQFGYQKRAVASFATSHNLDGIIFSSATQLTHVESEVLEDYVYSFSSVPIVSIGVDIPNIPSILVDCSMGLRNLIEHLIKKHNCKKFGFMTAGKTSIEADERFEVFKQVLAENNLEFDNSNLLYGFFSYEMAYKAMAEYEKSHGPIDFDALICINDNMALGAMDYCRDKRLSVPEDLKITGFDDIAKAAFSNPTLSSVNQQIREQGILSVQTLMQLINGQSVPHVQRVPTKARFRQSCGCVEKSDLLTDYLTENYVKVSFETSYKRLGMMDWFERRDQLVKLKYCFTNTQARIKMHDLLGRLQFELSALDISAAALCLYEKPINVEELFDYFSLPDKAYVFMSYDNDRQYLFKTTDDPELFNPNDFMIPKEYFDLSRGKIYVIALSFCEVQYGYMLVKPGSLDEVMYGFACQIISRWFADTFVHSNITAHTEKLNESNKLLKKISRTDDLTNLLNRRGFLELGQQSIDIAVKRKQTGVVIFGDMDGLKSINDTYGHDAGDRAIKSQADILLSVFRQSDIIGRIGGDEFAAVVVGMDHAKFCALKERLEKACDDWNQKSVERFNISISLGYAPFSADSCAISVLMQYADGYLYKEKRARKSKRE